MRIHVRNLLFFELEAEGFNADQTDICLRIDRISIFVQVKQQLNEADMKGSHESHVSKQE